MNDAPEEIVAVGLLQDPRRLSELKGFSPRWFSMPECCEVYRAAKAYHEGNLESGRVRYAARAAIERGVGERTRLLAERDGPDKDKAREREATRRAVERLLDSSGSWAHVDEHAFRDAADRVREAAKDAICREGLLRLVDVLKRGETKGLASRLRDLSVEVSAAEPTGSLTGTLSAEASATLAEYRLAKKTPGAGAIPTPFPRLNACAGLGGRPGRLWLVAAYAKGGKAQPLDAKVLTPRGWKRMGDIRIGSRVVNPESGTTRVRAVYDHASKPCFRVTFSDGATTECCDEHLWKVSTSTRRARGMKARVMTLAEIMQYGVRYHVPMPTPPDLQGRDGYRPLDPYLLGLLLGDGSFWKSGEVGFTTADDELVDAARALAPPGTAV